MLSSFASNKDFSPENPEYDISDFKTEFILRGKGFDCISTPEVKTILQHLRHHGVKVRPGFLGNALGEYNPKLKTVTIDIKACRSNFQKFKHVNALSLVMETIVHEAVHALQFISSGAEPCCYETPVIPGQGVISISPYVKKYHHACDHQAEAQAQRLQSQPALVVSLFEMFR